MVPTLLALDTSTDDMSLALTGPGGTVLHQSEGGARASARLIPEAMALLAQAGLSISQLDAVAFGAGPGAFTGLRTACAVAQGLAFGAGKPVLPLDSLMLVAETAHPPADAGSPWEVWVAMDARMDEVYAAPYRWTPSSTHGVRGLWEPLSPPALYAAEALRDLWLEAPPERVTGSALQVFGERLGLPAHAALPLAPTERPGALARLALQQWNRAGTLRDPADALPVYVRDKVARTTMEQQALRQSARTGTPQ